MTRSARSPGRRRALLCAGVAVILAAGGGAWVAARPGGRATATATEAPGRSHHRAPAAHHREGPLSGAGPVTPAVPPLGVYVGPGEAATAEAVDQQLGGHVVYALDFLSTDSWATLTHPTWLAVDWAGSPFRMVIGVPMLPAAGATLAEGAAGAFYGDFTALATRLVQRGLGDSVLMIGWQPDDPGTPWYVGAASTAHEYVQYWVGIRAAMSGIPGANFEFEWDAGNSGVSPVSPAAMYPGDAAVDIVATDAFDNATADPGAQDWTTVLNRRWGPAWMASFAAAHHKPMAVAMWGTVPRRVGGAGDDAAYVTHLLEWSASAGIQMCVLWDFGSWAMTGGSYPASAGALVATLSPPPATTAFVAPIVRTSWDAWQTGLGRRPRTLSVEPRRGRVRSEKSIARRGLGSG